MKLEFDVSAQEYAILRDILEGHLPKGVKVWVFGSRAKNTARFNSDLDLALEGAGALPRDIIPRLKDTLTDAPIAYRVDLVDMAEVSASFAEIIRAQAVRFPIEPQGNVPKLRFPGFNGAWKGTRLGKHAVKVGSGVTPKGGASVYQDSGIPLLRSQNVRDSFLDLSDVAYISDEIHESMSGSHVQDSDVLLNITGASIGRSCVAPKGTSPANVNQHVCIIRLDCDNSPEFIQTILASPKGEKLIFQSQAGGGREGLNFENVRKFRINLPTLPEQRKIAGCLGAVDTKIAQLASRQRLLEDYKKGCMQQLFSQKIRFTDDTGNDFPEWKEKRLGDVFSWINTNSLSRERLTYDGGHVQNIHYGDIHTKFAANFHQNAEPVPYVKDATPEDFKREQFCKIGDVVIADASEDHADIGKAIEIVSLGDKPMVAGLHTYIARPKPATVQTGFAGYLLRSAPMRRQIERIAQGISVLGISKGNLEKLTFFLPHPDEQRKIADFLSALDRKIDLVGQELTHTRTFKQGLLQQMFV